MFARMKALEPGLFEDASMHAAAATQLLVEDACVSKGHSLANWNSKKIIAGTPGYNTIKKSTYTSSSTWDLWYIRWHCFKCRCRTNIIMTSTAICPRSQFATWAGKGIIDSWDHSPAVQSWILIHAYQNILNLCFSYYPESRNVLGKYCTTCHLKSMLWCIVYPLPFRIGATFWSAFIGLKKKASSVRSQRAHLLDRPDWWDQAFSCSWQTKYVLQSLCHYVMFLSIPEAAICKTHQACRFF